MARQSHKETEADFCRAMGWEAGTYIAGDEGWGLTTVLITAVGESAVLARSVSGPGSGAETTWTFTMRDWSAVPPPADNPDPATPSPKFGHDPAVGKGKED